MDYRDRVDNGALQTGQEAGIWDDLLSPVDGGTDQQSADPGTVQGFKNSIESDDWDTQRYSDKMKSGQVEVSSINIDPNPVSSGGEVEVSISLTNRALFVNPVSPEYCDPDGYTTSTGIIAEVFVNPQWSPEITDSMCVPAQISQDNFSMTKTLVAPQIPEEAQFDSVTLPIDVTLRQPEREFKTKTFDIVVERGTNAPSGPRDEERGDEGDGGIGSGIVGAIVDNPIESALAVGAIGAALRFIPRE